MSALDALVEALRPALRPVAHFRLAPEAEVTLLGSHYGLPVYMEAHTTWPRCGACATDMDFLVQLNRAEAGLAGDDALDLVALFCCRHGACEERLGLAHPDRFALRTHWAPRPESMIWAQPSAPADRRVVPCAVAFQPGVALPDLQSLPKEAPAAHALLEPLADAPKRFTLACERLGAKHPLDDFLGGYPHWTHVTDLTPSCAVCHQRMRTLLQLWDFNRPDSGVRLYEQVTFFHCATHPAELAAVFDNT